MRLEKKAAKRHWGWKRLEEKSSKQSWDVETDSVAITFEGISGGSATYHYRLLLSLEDVARLINVIATDAVERSPLKVGESLEESVRALTKLSAIASGLSLAPPRTQDSERRS